MKTIPQRMLRNESGEVLRQAEAGQQFTITVGGRAVAQLGPIPRRRWVPRQEFLDLLAKGMADPGFFDDVADLNEPLDRLDEPWEPRTP